MQASLDAVEDKIFNAPIGMGSITSPSGQGSGHGSLERSLRKLQSGSIIDRYNAGRKVKRFGEKAIPGLLEIVEKGDSNARKTALFILADLESPAALPGLRKLASSSVDKSVRAGSLGILSKLRDPQAEDVFLNALSDPEKEVRSIALTGVRRLNTLKALPLLLKMTKRKENQMVSKEIEKTIVSLTKRDSDRLAAEIKLLTPKKKFTLLRILSKDQNQQLTHVLRDFLGDADPRVALGAARLLGQDDEDDVRAIAEKYAASDKPKALRSIAKEILNSLDKPPR